MVLLVRRVLLVGSVGKSSSPVGEPLPSDSASLFNIQARVSEVDSEVGEVGFDTEVGVIDSRELDVGGELDHVSGFDPEVGVIGVDPEVGVRGVDNGELAAESTLVKSRTNGDAEVGVIDSCELYGDGELDRVSGFDSEVGVIGVDS